MAKANSTPKPWLHKASNLWCVKRKDKRYYLGRTEAEAVRRYKRYQRFIDQGRPIPDLTATADQEANTAATVKNVLLLFLASQKQRFESGDLARRSLSDYVRTCSDFADFVGDEFLIDDLKPVDFADYRSDVAKRRNLVSVGNEVTRVKTAFKWLYESDLLEQPIKFGPDFKRPKKADVKRYKRTQSKQIFTPAEIMLLQSEVGIHLRAMVLLGINGAFGNSECSDLRLSEVDFDKGEIVAIRTKTAADRLVTLWPETIEALKLSLRYRPEANTGPAKERFFVSTVGDVFTSDDNNAKSSNVITMRTTQALQRLKIHEPGKSFYWLRHTFRSVADTLPDQAAIGLIMGHVDDRMAANYVHSFPRERVRAATDHVRSWLFGGVK